MQPTQSSVPVLQWRRGRETGAERDSSSWPQEEAVFSAGTRGACETPAPGPPAVRPQWAVMVLPLTRHCRKFPSSSVFSAGVPGACGTPGSVPPTGQQWYCLCLCTAGSFPPAALALFLFLLHPTPVPASQPPPRDTFPHLLQVSAQMSPLRHLS